MKVKMNNIAKGNVVLMDNVLHQVIDFYTVKPGKGGAFAQVKMRNMETGSTFEKRFRTEDSIERVILEEKAVQFLYSDSEGFHFMDNTSYEQFTLTPELVADNKHFMLDNMDVSVLFHGERPLTVNLPVSVNLKVTYTEPGVKGNTVSGGAMKTAKMETGYEVQVPLFIENDELLKIDTRTGEYLSRA